jgi:hypothetical protein
MNSRNFAKKSATAQAKRATHRKLKVLENRITLILSAVCFLFLLWAAVSFADVQVHKFINMATTSYSSWNLFQLLEYVQKAV